MTTCVLNQRQAWWALSLLWICHHISPSVPTRETWCVVPPLVRHAFKKRCNLRTTMWCHFQIWTSSTSNIVNNSWWHNLSLSNSWRFLKWLSYYWHPRPIKKPSSSLKFLQWSCQVRVSTWFAILWWSFLCFCWPYSISSSLNQAQYFGYRPFWIQ
jgi:hypothetical protein